MESGWSGSPRSPHIALDELCDRRDDRLLLLRRQLAVNRDGEALVGGPLRLRERAAPVAEVGEARLQVERHRVIDLVADPLLIEMAFQRVALRRPDDELVV